MARRFSLSAILSEEERKRQATVDSQLSTPAERQTAEAPGDSQFVPPSENSATMADSANLAQSAKTAEYAKTAESAIVTQSAIDRPENRPVAESAKMAEYATMTDFAVVDGWLAIPNTIVDTLCATLDDSTFKIYLRLYRLSHGHKHEHCRVSHEGLGRGCNMGTRTVQRALDKLELHGLVTVLKKSVAKDVKVAQGGGGGNTYRVLVPGHDGVFTTRSAKSTESANLADYANTAESAKLAHIKEQRKKIHEKAPVAVAPAPEFSVYDIRRIAARFRELHHGEADYTRDQLRADVRTALIGEGREPDERLIDEAIGA